MRLPHFTSTSKLERAADLNKPGAQDRLKSRYQDSLRRAEDKVKTLSAKAAKAPKGKKKDDINAKALLADTVAERKRQRLNALA